MARILFIACGFDGGRSGISVYIREVLRRLAAAHSVTVVCTGADRDAIPAHPSITFLVLPRWLNRPAFNMLYVLFAIGWRFRKDDFDFLLLPAANRRAVWRSKWPGVAVVHDLSQFHIPAKYDCFRMFYVKRLLPRAVRRLTHCVAVSHNTATDLVRHWGLDPDRITVLYNGYDRDRFQPSPPAGAPDVLARHGLTGPYILYVARLEHPGKNHRRLIQAYEQLPADLRRQYALVLGGAAWPGAEAITGYAQASPCRDRIRFLGFVPPGDLPALYHGAALYVFPSLYEGFGLSMPEAMACGTVVAGSDNSSLGEIAGDAAITFDPESVPAMAAAMLRGLTDDDERRQRRERGFRRALDFDWDRHAAGLVELGLNPWLRRHRLLGITYDNVSMAEALDYIFSSLRNRQRRQIAFVNADCFNKGFANPAYRELLTHFDQVYPDGSGVALAGRLLGRPVKANVNGTDMLPLLAETAAREGFSLYLLGAKPGVAEKMRANLMARFPGLRIVGCHDGYHLEQVDDDINQVRPDLLLVALGVPLQEQFIVDHFASVQAGVMIGVGGLFDFYSGNIPRAPRWLRRLGLEWTFRLAMEPRRMFRRYIIGNPLFLWRVLRHGRM